MRGYDETQRSGCVAVRILDLERGGDDGSDSEEANVLHLSCDNGVSVLPARRSGLLFVFWGNPESTEAQMLMSCGGVLRWLDQ